MWVPTEDESWKRKKLEGEKFEKGHTGDKGDKSDQSDNADVCEDRDDGEYDDEMRKLMLK